MYAIKPIIQSKNDVQFSERFITNNEDNIYKMKDVIEDTMKEILEIRDPKEVREMRVHKEREKFNKKFNEIEGLLDDSEKAKSKLLKIFDKVDDLNK